jgi:predicted transcriptional regulator
MNKGLRKDFFMVANKIFELGLKPRDFIVFCCLLRHADAEKLSCFPSRRKIAAECQIDSKTVDTAIKNLCDLGLVRKVHRKRCDGSKTSNKYYLTDLIERNNE